MDGTNDCVLAVNAFFFPADERNFIDDGLADDDSWVENISQDEDDLNEINSFSGTNLQTDSDEGLQGYINCNALDFTLHTIAEESCEDSELEHYDNGVIEDSINRSEIAPISQSELEKYFFFGLGDGKKCPDQEDSSSEVFSESSDNLDTIAKNDVFLRDSKHALDLSTSRLERYFLSGFMGFNTENKSDGSVGSDSEGQASPNHRKKKFVRARGTPRSINSSMDNLLLETTDCLVDATETLDSSESETESLPLVGILCEKGDSVDPAKRKKSYRKRELLECGKKTAESIVRFKNQSNAEPGACQKSSVNINELNNLPTLSAKSCLERKDNFYYSSDEETNLMMSKMRQFFKTLIAVTAQSCNSQSNNFGTYSEHIFQKRRINNQQVREIVEYFSSEETWSDSNDSSDCTGSNHSSSPNKIKNGERLAEFQKSCFTDTRTRNGSIDETLNTGSVLAYANLIESLISNNSKMDPEVLNVDSMCKNYKNNDKCPELAISVMQHIGSKLVALMHDVSIGTDSIVTADTENDPRKSDENSKTKLDQSDYSSQLWGNLPRSKSHDVLLGSTNRSWHFNSSSTVSDNQGEASDCDRFSWRGSFESALLAPGDSTSKLLFTDRDNCSISSEVSMSKRGSADNLPYTIIQNREQLDRVQSCGSIGIDKRTRSEIQKSWLSSLSVMKCETNSELSSRSNVNSLIYTNSLPRLQSLEFPVISDKSQSDSNVIRFNAKSARYRSPSNQSNIFSPLSTKNNLKKPGDMTASTSLDDFFMAEFSNSPSFQKNARQSENLGIHSDSLISVYSEIFDNRYDNIQIKGQIEFAMQYNYKISAFEIHVVKCKDLAVADTKRWKSDPYVKIYLLPDKSKNGKRKTKVKKNTLNPIFDEIVRFNVSIANLETRSIWVTVWHSDIFGRNNFLGAVTISLKGKVFDNPQPQWYLLQEKDGQIDKNVMNHGDLVVALKFIVLDSHITSSDCSYNKIEKVKPHSKGQLHVLIKEAKNLQSPKPSGTCDTFCKSYLLPNRTRTSKQKTHVFKKSLNPVWNFTFIYDSVTLQELSERALELTIWDRDRLISNQFLGGARFSLGTGERYGSKVSWMDSTGKEIFLWREMMNRPNFWVEGCISLRSVLDAKKEDNVF